MSSDKRKRMCNFRLKVSSLAFGLKYVGKQMATIVKLIPPGQKLVCFKQTSKSHCELILLLNAIESCSTESAESPRAEPYSNKTNSSSSRAHRPIQVKR